MSNKTKQVAVLTESCVAGCVLPGSSNNGRPDRQACQSNFIFWEYSERLRVIEVESVVGKEPLSVRRACVNFHDLGLPALRFAHAN